MKAGLLGLVLLTGCGPLAGAGANPSASPLPSTVKGSVAFSPEEGASELDPAHIHLVVKSVAKSATLKTVVIQTDGGDDRDAPLKGGSVDLSSGFRADHLYTITATASVKDAAGAISDEVETSSFRTATTPKIVAIQPQEVTQGQATVVSLSPAASAVSVDGPVQGQLGPDGTTLTLLPTAFKQGATFDFVLTAKNLKGIAGEPQPAHFASLPPATAGAYPDTGMSNLGVGMPLTVTLSAPPADRADLASHLKVSVEVQSAAPAPPPPAPSPGASPSPANPCASQYNTTQVASGDLPVKASWVTDRRVRLTPATPDGYWPSASTIHLNGAITGLKTAAGNSFETDITTMFKTADKRVVDVDLGTQTLTTCKNGVMDNQFPISSGTDTHPTYTGTFYIYSRVADEEMKSPEGPFAPDYYDIKHVPWTQYFDGGAALHGAWWHNNFGHPMSHGCVNVQTPTQNTRWPSAKPQAEYLWSFDYIGDPVIVHGVTPGLTAATQPSD